MVSLLGNGVFGVKRSCLVSPLLDLSWFLWPVISSSYMCRTIPASWYFVDYKKAYCRGQQPVIQWSHWLARQHGIEVALHQLIQHLAHVVHWLQSKGSKPRQICHLSLDSYIQRWWNRAQFILKDTGDINTSCSTTNNLPKSISTSYIAFPSW